MKKIKGTLNVIKGCSIVFVLAVTFYIGYITADKPISLGNLFALTLLCVIVVITILHWFEYHKSKSDFDSEYKETLAKAIDGYLLGDTRYAYFNSALNFCLTVDGYIRNKYIPSGIELTYPTSLAYFMISESTIHKLVESTENSIEKREFLMKFTNEYTLGFEHSWQTDLFNSYEMVLEKFTQEKYHPHWIDYVTRNHDDAEIYNKVAQIVGPAVLKNALKEKVV